MKIWMLYVCKIYCFIKNLDICVWLVYLYKLVLVGSLNIYLVCVIYVVIILGKVCFFLVNIVNFFFSWIDFIKKLLFWVVI